VTFVSEEKLIAMALDALEQAAANSDTRKVQRSRSIAVCLAFLATRRKFDRWPFDQFWQFLDVDDNIIRTANLTRCLNGIYFQLGIKRTKVMMLKHKQSQKIESGH